jgi:putative transposase
MLTKLPTISRKRICSVLVCNRSSTYRTSKVKERDTELIALLQVIKLSNPWYGLKRLKVSLKLEYNITVNIKKLRRICKANGIIAKTRSKLSNLPKRDVALPDMSQSIPNLVAQYFEVTYRHVSGDETETQTETKTETETKAGDETETQTKAETEKTKLKQKPKLISSKTRQTKDLKPNQIWASDFTYIKYNNQFYYLATTIDIFTKEITGFHLSTTHNTNLISIALKQAIRHYGSPEILHSDQGSEYRSQEYQELLKTNNIKCSMSQKSSPWQNGFQESYYNNFKLELELNLLPKNLTFAELYNYIENQIDYYNNRRIHTSILNIPTRFRQQYHQNQKYLAVQTTQKPKESQNKKPKINPKQEENLVLQ